MVCRSRLLLAIALLLAKPTNAVSVLSHEEMVDVTWESEILPLLRTRFPDASPEQLKKAHAFAYGGAVIQDVGYYPLGNKFYTNLLHYVRSGDFIVFLIRDARNVNEYAFALGVLGHYAADSWGHQAVNASEPTLYPKLKRKFGNYITYEDNHEAHLRTEFSFDVLEVASIVTTHSSITISSALTFARTCWNARFATPTEFAWTSFCTTMT
jgi:Zinc dependent phospholipase C